MTDFEKWKMLALFQFTGNPTLYRKLNK